MSDVVIQAEALGKRYSLRHQAKQGLFRDRLTSLLKAPFRRGRTGSGSGSKEEFWALRDLTFSIQRGDVVGVVGRNGAGKSTLLKILSRITEPTTGRVTIQGRIASLLEVGTGFHGELSGRENIFLNGAILGMSRAEIRRKFDEIVAFSEVEKFLDTPVKHYSSGMYVRLAFAVAAHLEPEILIVDEVLAVGDAAFQKKCLGKLRDVSQGEGRTVLFVSHNLSAIRQLCTSAILLSSGRLVAFDRTSPILDLYAQGTTRQEKSSVPAPPPDLLTRAYLTGAAIETLDGNSPVVIPVGVPWCIKLSFRLARPMADFVAAIGITMNDGTAVQTVWAPPRRLEPGDYIAVFSADRAILAVGSYLVSAGLTEKEQSIQQLEIGRIDIGADGAAGYFQMVAGVGLILNSMKVEIRPAAP